MPKYKYTAVDHKGKTTKDTIFAVNMVEFNIKLKQQNLFCLNVQQIKDAQKASVVTNKSVFTMKELSVFCKQFATMLNSGITIMSALDVIYRQTTKAKNKDILLKLYEQVQTGKNLSEAMSSIPGGFPKFMISMVQAGEASGTLDVTMGRLAVHYEKDIKLKNQVSSAMIYPIILGIVGVVVVLGIFTFVIPSIMGMLGDPAKLPFTTRMLFSFSKLLTSRWYIVMAAAVALVLSVKMLKYVDQVAELFDYIKLKAPVFGVLYVQVMAASFCRTMCSVFSSGLSLIESLELAANILNNRFVAEKIERVTEEIRSGSAFSSSLAKTGIFPQMLITMLKVGEESGELDTILGKTSDYYDVEAEAAIQKMVALIEPLMIVVLGIVIGVVVISILGPIYSNYANVGA